jgi:5-(carboxyamino)imidazole ribonucleotide mutase
MAKVAIVMGSTSDWPTMKLAAEMLQQLGVEYHARLCLHIALLIY